MLGRKMDSTYLPISENTSKLICLTLDCLGKDKNHHFGDFLAPMQNVMMLLIKVAI